MTARRPVKRNIEIEQGTNFPFALRLYHSDLDGDQDLFNTGGYTARFTVRQGDWDGDIVVAADQSDYIDLGYTPAPWVANTAYGLGQYAVPTVLNGFIYQVTVAGTSHVTTQPIWPTAINATVVDGTVTWKCISTDSWLVNLYLNLPSAYTETLDDWGAGVWDLELEDAFGNVQTLYRGAAWLQREASY